MNASKKLPLVLLSIFMLIFLTFGCVHKKISQKEAGMTPSNPIVTKSGSDFYALHLSGKNELSPRPNVNASGKLFLNVGKEGDKVHFTLYVNSLKNITRATINYGTKKYNGPPILRLYPARHSHSDSLIGRTFSGMLAAGTITKPYLVEGALEDGDISDLIRVIKMTVLMFRSIQNTFPMVLSELKSPQPENKAIKL